MKSKNSPIFLIPRGLKKLNVTKTRMHIGIKEIRELEKSKFKELRPAERNRKKGKRGDPEDLNQW